MEKRDNPPPYIATQPGHPMYPNIPQDSSPPYLPPPPPTQHTVVVTHAVLPALGPSPVTINNCPSCHAHITTSVQTEATTKTHLFALLLCIFGCWPCCCIPYCMDSCQSQNHYCPNCRAFLGKYDN